MNIKKMLSIILFVISVGLIVTGFYILNSSKYIFKTVLSKSLDTVIETIYKSNVILDDFNNSDKFMINTDTKFKMMEQEMFILTGNISVDKDNFYTSLNSKIKGEEFIKVESLINQEKLYFKFKDAIDKFYYYDFGEIIEILEVENYSSINELTKNDIKVLVEILEKSILQNLKNSDFEKNSEALTFDGKTYKTNQISLNLSEKELRQIIVNLFNNIINDNKAIQILQKVDNSITANDIKEALSYFEEETIDSSDNDIINISFYISGLSGIVKAELLTFDNTKITFDLYKNNANKNVTNMSIKESNVEVINIKLIEEDDIKTTFNITTFNMMTQDIKKMSINGDYSVTDESIVANVKLDYDNQTIGNLTYSILQVAKNKEYKIELKVGALVNMVDFSSVNTIILNEDIAIVNTNDAENIEEITEEDFEKINIYFNERMTLLGLDSLFEISEEEYDFEDIVE